MRHGKARVRQITRTLSHRAPAYNSLLIQSRFSAEVLEVETTVSG